MAFIKNLNQDGVREKFLVKADRKKVWERQLEIWQEVDRICRKHVVTYWAAYETLLGAARHSGFIPWYDKFELCMMRPDFNRFCQVVEDELQRGGNLFEIRFKHFARLVIAHSQTTLLVLDDLKGKSTGGGLLIEIFPLDAASDGTAESIFAANGIKELFATVYDFSAVEKYLASGISPANELRVIHGLHALPEDKQLEFLNQYAEGVFSWSSKVNRIDKLEEKLPQAKAWYRSTISLPFESIELPAPVDYEKVLTSIYGDWRKFVYDKKNRLGVLHSADIPYTECLKFINPEMLLNLFDDEKKSDKTNSEEATH